MLPISGSLAALKAMRWESGDQAISPTLNSVPWVSAAGFTLAGGAAISTVQMWFMLWSPLKISNAPNLSSRSLRALEGGPEETNAILFPSGDHWKEPAFPSKSVTCVASPPVGEIR